MTASGEAQDLYTVLGVDRDASQAAIKKAYHRLALQLHPDRNEGSEEATQKFQDLQTIYGILSDADKRKRYDQTGSMEEAEELNTQSFEDLYTYFRVLYKKLTTEDIENFSAKYRGSDEEMVDLLKGYQRFEGNMKQVFQWQICSDAARDSHRFCAAIRDHCAKSGEKPHAAFTKWAKAVDKKPPPKDPLRPLTSPPQAGAEQALVAAIRGRGQERADAALAALEAKYCKSPASKRARAGKPQAVGSDDEQNQQPQPRKQGKGKKVAKKAS